MRTRSGREKNNDTPDDVHLRRTVCASSPKKVRTHVKKNCKLICFLDPLVVFFGVSQQRELKNAIKTLRKKSMSKLFTKQADGGGRIVPMYVSASMCV
jgi:hypothetical protein